MKGYVAGGERLDLATLTKAQNTKSTKNIEKRITENTNSELLNAVKSIVPIKDIKLKIKGFTKGKYQLKITVSEAKSKTQTSQDQDLL